MRARAVVLTALVAIVLPSTAAGAQQPGTAAPRALTAADYARAERFMSYNTTPLVFRAGIRPTALPDDRFWYRNAIPEGIEFVLVDAARRTRARAFDQGKLAAALTRAADTTYDALHLPFRSEEHTSELQSRLHLVCRLLLEKKKKHKQQDIKQPCMLCRLSHTQQQ